MGVASNWTRARVDPNRPPVLGVRADCGCRLFTAKLAVVLHYLPHQLLDDRPRHTLQRSEAALSDGCKGFRTRSLKLANRANRHTLKAAPAAAILVSESSATGETKKAAQRFSAIGR